MKRPLPIGIQSFQEIREKNYLYVDKTADFYRLVSSGKYYFLSRPRCFGKSLMLSSLKGIFKGSRELFEGLWIENYWDWQQQYPVIHLHFESIGHKDKGLRTAISEFLMEEAQKHEIKLLQQYPGGQLASASFFE